MPEGSSLTTMSLKMKKYSEWNRFFKSNKTAW